MPPRDTESYQGRVDDVSDDAAAAYAEVLERTAAETVAPRNGRASETNGDGDRGSDGGSKRWWSKPEKTETKTEVKPEPKTEVKADPKAKATDDTTGKGKKTDDVGTSGRDERGRFKGAGGKDGADDKSGVRGKGQDAGGEPAEDGDAAGEAEGEGDDTAAAAVKGGPPASWSIKSKAIWDTLPADVRADVLKREADAKAGLQGLQDFKDLKPYADMAKQHGTTISKALERYVGLENMLKKDLGSGLAVIAQNYGLDQRAAAGLFASLAARFGGGAPTTGAPPQPQGATDPLMEALRPLFEPLTQQINGLQSKLNTRETNDMAAAEKAAQEVMDTFAADPAHKFFSNLLPTMEKLMASGLSPVTGNHAADLKAAYELAASMNPEIQQALIEQRLEDERRTQRQKDQEAADKAKKASKSIAGTRIPGTVVKEATDGEDEDPNDVEADVRRAIRMLSHT